MGLLKGMSLMKGIYLVLFLFVFSVFSVSSLAIEGNNRPSEAIEKEIESLVLESKKHTRDLKVSLKLSNQALNLFNTLENPSEKLSLDVYYSYFSSIVYLPKEKKKSLNFEIIFNQVVKLATTLKDYDKLILIYIEKANVSALTQEYILEFNYSKKALELARKHKFKGHIAGIINNQASAYTRVGLYELALKLFNKAEQIDGGNELYKRNIAYIYQLQGKFTQAKRELIKLTQEFPKSRDVKIALISLFIEMNNIKEAEAILDEVNLLNKNRLNLEYFENSIYLLKSKILVKKGLHEQAIPLMIKTLPLNDVTYREPKYLLNTYLSMAKSYQALSNNKLASYYFDLYSELAQSHYKNTMNQGSTYLTMELDVARKDAEAKQTKLNLEKASEKIKLMESQKMWQLIAITLAALLILFLVVFILKLKKNSRRLDKLAMTDELTELPNRRSVMSSAQQAFSSVLSGDEKLTIAILDIDHFKLINDKYGHDVGDIVLKEIAIEASSVLRQGEMLGRVGGEEFLVVLNKSNLKQASVILERLREKINHRDFAGDHKLSVSVSCGVVEYKDEKTLLEIIKKADNALYEAKSTGRNKVVHVA